MFAILILCAITSVNYWRYIKFRSWPFECRVKITMELHDVMRTQLDQLRNHRQAPKNMKPDCN